MSIAKIFEDIATGLASFAPAFAKSIWLVFCNLFLTFTEASEGGAITVTGLNPLGTLAIVGLVIGMVYKVVPTAIGFLGKLRARRAKRKA